MKLFRLLLLAVGAAQIPVLPAQDAASPDPEATLRYIHAGWDTLTRSMTDCHSLADIKITTQPVLYVPAEIPVPAEVTAVQQKCHVKVLTLPRRID